MIDIKDEIIEGNPKYNITPNSDGTNKIELANEVVQEGSALNRSVFKDINNVAYERPDSFSKETISGNLCNVFNFNNITETPRLNQRICVDMSGDNVWSQQEIHKIIDVLKVGSVTPVWSGSTYLGKIDIEMTMDKISYFKGINCKLITYATNGWYASSSTAADYSSIISYYNGSNVASNSALMDNFNRTDYNSSFYNYIRSNTSRSIILYDLGENATFTFNARLNENLILYTSNDGVTWSPEIDLTAGSFTRTFTVPCRYVKIEIPYGTSVKLYYMYFSNVEYSFSEYSPFINEGIHSEIINNIPCKDLLYYGEKYKLVYDGEKYINDSNKVLFDITLTEAVNKVDLTGISDMLEEGKLYALIIKGSLNTNSSYIELGSNYVMSIDDSFAYSPFIFSVSKNIGCIISGIRSSTSENSTFCVQSIISGEEYIKVNTNSYKLKAGTRIIIKEVA